MLNPNWLPNISEDFEGLIVPESVRPVASYSWMFEKEEDKQKIAVPGCPLLWLRREYPFMVPRDTQTCYTRSYSGHPLHPIFLSVKLMEPNFKFESMDVITDKSVLRNLLRWNSSGGEYLRLRNIEAELFGSNTILLTCPWDDEEKSTWTRQSGFSGSYRRNSERYHTYTSAEWKETTGQTHYRIITYKFGSLNIMTRFPVDISFPSEEFQLPSLGSIKSKGTSSCGLEYVHHEGSLMNQDSTSELNVLHRMDPSHWNNVWHNLYFSWSARYTLINHEGNQVTGSSQHFLQSSQEIQRCINGNAGPLKRVEDLLHHIRRFVIEQNEKTKQNDKLRFKFFKHKRGIEVMLVPSDASQTQCQIDQS